MFVDGISELLASNGTVASMLNIATRNDHTNGIFPMIAPKEPVTPYIVYQEVARRTILTYEGVNLLQELRFQFSCYAVRYQTAKYLAAAVKNVLDGFVGVLSDAQNTIVESTVPNSEHDELDVDLKSTIYGTILDYTFWTNDGQAGSGPLPPPGPVYTPPFTQPYTLAEGQTIITLPIVPPGDVVVFWGQTQALPGVDYTISGATITLLRPGNAGDNVTVLVL